MQSIFLDKTISEIQGDLLTGRLDPVDLIDIFHKRHAEFQGKFYPFVCIDEAYARHKAIECRESLKKVGVSGVGLLDGMPVGVKDIFNTIDYPMEMGSPLWKGFTPSNDARVVSYLKNGGGIIAGKTVTAEFAIHALNETKNPHNIDCTPGTSSSGSAVAIALGMVPVALGSQTAGSIIRPASFCGVYGCKPSFGLIPRTGSLKTTDSLDTIGFFTTRYADLQRVFEVVRVRGPNYPMSYQAFKDPDRIAAPENRPWKIGFVKTHTWAHAYDYAKKAMCEWVDIIAAQDNVQVEEFQLPSEMDEAHSIHETIYNKALSYYFQEEYKKSELISPVMNEMIRAGQRAPVEQYHYALEAQVKLCRLMDSIIQPYDVLVSLSTAGEAPLRNVVERPDPCLMWTMMHLPVIGVPQFVSPNGMPYGLQLVSRRYNDYKLFKFADHLHSKGLIPSGPNPRLKLA